MPSAREGEVIIVTTLHFSDVVHVVDGRMLGALDEYVGGQGASLHRCFGGSAAFNKAFLWDCLAGIGCPYSLALQASRCRGNSTSPPQ